MAKKLFLIILINFFYFSSSLFGAVSFDSAGGDENNSTASSATVSLNVSTANDRILIAWGSCESSAASTNCNLVSMTFNSVSLTCLNDIQQDNQRIHGCYLIAPDEGTHNLVYTQQAGGAEIKVSYIVLNGVNQVEPEANETAVGNGTTSVSLNITTQTNGAWIVESAVSGNSTSTPDVANSQTVRYELNGDDYSKEGATKEIASAGVQTVGWTDAATNDWVQSAFSVAPSGGVTMKAQIF